MIDDTNAIYLTDDTPNAEPRYRARFYFDPNSLTMANNDAHFIFKGFQGTSTEVVRVEFRNSSGAYQVRAALLDDGSTWINTNWFTITDASHYLEVDWRGATGAGTNDGGLTLWIDGAQQADLTGIDNDTWRVDRARIGALSSLDAGTSGTYYFDAFESRRSNYIGPMAFGPSMHFASYEFIPALQTSSLTFTPADDAYIANGSPTSNYGSATTLQVDNSPIKHFLLKFDVTGVDGQTMTNAKIRLYNVNAANAGGKFYPVADDSWQEETVTWNNAPTADTQLLASLGSVSVNTWYEVDVTSLVTGDGTYSFRISDSVGGADYSSKEGANDPELVLTLGGTPVATNTPTNTAIPGPSPAPTNTLTPTISPTATTTTPPPAPFNSATFVYDGDGKRVKSIFNGTTTTYFVGNHYEVTGSAITKYYYAGTQRIAMRTNGTLNYLLGDHLGSTSLTTDANGDNLTEIYYKTWGEIRYASDSSPTKYQYTGQFSYESEFGLMYYGARWYDPALGRFNQPDSVVPDPNNSQGWDRYSYTFNNPVRYIDPDGHFPIPLIALFVIGAVTLTADNPLPDASAPVQQAINEIKESSATDAAALVTMFTSDELPGNTPNERLEVVLDATSDGPFTHFEILFGDSGFRDELRDPWPDTSGNQVGHFLTAVDIGYNVDNNALGLGAIVGHEMYPDELPQSTPVQIVLGLTHPQERDLFALGTDEAFGQILNNGWGPLENRTGNSMQDLRLSYWGWTMGRLYRQGFFTNHASVTRWLQEHIAE